MNKWWIGKKTCSYCETEGYFYARDLRYKASLVSSISGFYVKCPTCKTQIPIKAIDVPAYYAEKLTRGSWLTRMLLRVA